MVRADPQRRLLHEFDLALTQLRETAGDSDTTVALVGKYHNLLRLRAET
jgi:predicted 2-oxoglutarate/Fe(II)-dependent dioxygenase YbiX